MNVRGSCDAFVQSEKRCDGLGNGEHNPMDQFETRTEVVYEHCRAFDERKHRVLLQLHIPWNLSRVIVLRAQCQNGRAVRTADFAMPLCASRFTSARGSSKFSMPSETASAQVLLSLGGRWGARVVLSWHWQATNRSRLPGRSTAFCCKVVNEMK